MLFSFFTSYFAYIHQLRAKNITAGISLALSAGASFQLVPLFLLWFIKSKIILSFLSELQSNSIYKNEISLFF